MKKISCRQALFKSIGLGFAGLSFSLGLLNVSANAGEQAQDAVTLDITQMQNLQTNQVNIAKTNFKDRDALSVEMTDEVQKAILSGNGNGNAPSYALPDIELANGVIEVDIAASINGKGPADVRGFVGIAFHIDDKNKTFEAIYLRMTNGSKNNPPPPAPRDIRAVQYISYPDRTWSKLREAYPTKYEKAAPVAINSWHKLRLEIKDNTVDVFVDDAKVLTVNDLSFANRKGKIGLWVDDGTTGYFTNLKVNQLK